MKNEMMKKLTSAPQIFSSESLTLMVALKLALVVALLMGASTATLADEAFPETTDNGEVIALVNINADDAEKMAELLDGVGVVRAEAIVEYREAMGGLANWKTCWLSRALAQPLWRTTDTSWCWTIRLPSIDLPAQPDECWCRARDTALCQRVSCAQADTNQGLSRRLRVL